MLERQEIDAGHAKVLLALSGWRAESERRDRSTKEGSRCVKQKRWCALW